MFLQAPSLFFTAGVNFGVNLGSFLVQSVTVLAMGHLLLRAKAPSFLHRLSTLGRTTAHGTQSTSAQWAPVELSLSMTIYLCAHISLTLISLPSYIYAVVNWRPESRPDELYTPFWVYWLTLLNDGYYINSPLTVFFLVTDRCLALGLAVYPQLLTRAQKWLAIVSVFSLTAVYLWVLATFSAADAPFEQIYNAPNASECVPLQHERSVLD